MFNYCLSDFCKKNNYQINVSYLLDYFLKREKGLLGEATVTNLFFKE